LDPLLVAYVGSGNNPIRSAVVAGHQAGCDSDRQSPAIGLRYLEFVSSASLLLAPCDAFL